MRLKRKIISVSVFFGILTLLLSFYAPDLELLSFEMGPTGKTTSIIHEESDEGINVYFCPYDQCEDALIEFVTSAEESIHCAFYDLDLENLTDALEEKAKEVFVDIVIDEDNEEEYNNSFVTVNTAYALMHHKFCVVDKKKILSGSLNPTIRGATLNNNNLVIINSRLLAQNYLNEFEEVKNNNKKSNTSTITHVELGEVLIENYFCPEDNCADHIVEALQKAENSIYFMTFSFTHDRIATTLAMKKQEGVKIKGVMEARQVTKYSQFEFLNFQDMEIYKDGNKANMHHKVFIIDNSTVITGSFNPSKNADTRNDENVLIIHDEEVAMKFLKEFERVWKEAKADETE